MTAPNALTSAGSTLNPDLWFKDPGAVAFRTFGRLGQLFCGKLETASAAADRLHDRLVFGMHETAEKMLKVIGNPAGWLILKPRDLTNRHRISLLRDRISAVCRLDTLEPVREPSGLVRKSLLLVKTCQGLVPLKDIESHTGL